MEAKMAGAVTGGGGNIYRDLLAAARANAEAAGQRNQALIRFTDTSLDRVANELNQFISTQPSGERIALQGLQRGGLVDRFT